MPQKLEMTRSPYFHGDCELPLEDDPENLNPNMNYKFLIPNRVLEHSSLLNCE